jgi:hypothetical protein
MELKEKNISLVVGITKRVPDLAVSLSFSFPGIAECCFNSLVCNCVKEGELMKGAHEAALAYALFEAARDKLVSSPLEVSKSRVSNIACKTIDGEFTISWNCQGTGSSLRKSCGLVVSCLAPHKLFSKYSENIRFLGRKPGNKDDFIFCVKKASEGIKKHIQISAVGKVSTDEKKLKDILGVIVKKLPGSDNLGSGKAPTITPREPNKNEREDPLIKCSGVVAICVADYIRSNSGGMSVDVANHGVTVYNTQWESKKKQLVETRRIKDYVDKKYTRLGAEFSNLLAYFAITQKYANAFTVAKIIKSKQSVDKLASEIKDVLGKKN